MTNYNDKLILKDLFLFNKLFIVIQFTEKHVSPS